MKRFALVLLALTCAVSLFALMPGHLTAQTKTEICDNGIDDDGDKLVDCDDPDCKCNPGNGCSPGYWKNHRAQFDQYCQAAADVPGDQFTTCAELWTALNCRGSNEFCGRSAAAAALNQVSGCTE